MERRVDGLIIAASNLGVRHAEWLAAAPLPVVLINTAAPGTALPSIASDNHDGGRQSADHLLAHGHRRFGYLMPPPRNVDAPQRLGGVRAALDAAGLEAVAITVTRGAPLVGGGEAAMLELLDQAPDTTAVIAYNDLMAIGALRAVRQRRRRVPDDVSIIGFDDIDMASYVEPSLTSVAQGTAEMGRWAVDRLTRGIRADGNGRGSAGGGHAATEDDAARTISLPVRLVVRGSTGPAPAA